MNKDQVLERLKEDFGLPFFNETLAGKTYSEEEYLKRK